MTSIKVTETVEPVTVDIMGLNDISATLALTQPFSTQSDNTVTVNPLQATLDTNSDLNTKSELKVDPLLAGIDTKSQLKTDSSVLLDVKPAVVDLCVTLNVGKVPNLCIKQPYHHHIGFSLWGSEIWGCTFTGEAETVIQEQRPQPKVALGKVVADWPGHHAYHREPGGSPEPPTRETGGLRIRLSQ
jgi:hypothetical protein